MKKGSGARAARLAIRVTSDDQGEIARIAKSRGYSSPSAFIRAALRNEIHGREELSAIEDRISGSLERLSREHHRISRTQQALFALVDALSKAILTCVPEPGAAERPQAVALGKERHHRLIKAAGLSMSGESRATLEGLVQS